MAYFFIPLPEPLALPVEYPSVFRSFEDTSTFLKRTADKPSERIHGPDEIEFVSLISHRLRWNNPAAGIDDSLIELTRMALPWLADTSSENLEHGSPKPTEIEPDLHTHAVTIVEGATTLPASDDENEQHLSKAFDRVIAKIRDLQTAYYLARRADINLVTKEMLPSTVLFAIADIDENGNFSDEQGLGLFLTNPNFQGFEADKPLEDSEIKLFESSLDLINDNHPVIGILDLDREALTAIKLRGDYRAAVIFTATVAEARLDLLLLFLLWENNVSPKQAATYFDNRGIAYRVKAHYSSLIGGKWGLNDEGPVRDWFLSVAKLRNRVVHAGYEPSAQEAWNAIHSAAALSTYLIDLLAESKILEKFPRTAITFASKGGLQSRKKWTKEIRLLSEKEDEPLWSLLFNNWKEWVDRYREESNGDVPEDSVSGVPYAPLAVVLENNEVSWVLHDLERKQAVRAKAISKPKLVQDTLETIKKHTKETRDNGYDGPFSCLVNIQLEETGEWAEEYYLVPEARITMERHLPYSWSSNTG